MLAEVLEHGQLTRLGCHTRYECAPPQSPEFDASALEHLHVALTHHRIEWSGGYVSATPGVAQSLAGTQLSNFTGGAALVVTGAGALRCGSARGEDGVLRLQGTRANVQACLDGLVYTPAGPLDGVLNNIAWPRIVHIDLLAQPAAGARSGQRSNGASTFTFG